MTNRDFELYFITQKREVEIIASSFSKTSSIPKEEFISALSEVLWDIYRKFDITKGASLNTWTSKLLKRKAIDIIRESEGTYYKNTIQMPLIKNEEGEETSLEESIEDSTDNYYDVIKKADQRQLIDFIRDANPDATTTTIVEAYLTAPPSATRNEIAKKLGLNHEVIRRKLVKLRSLYDANRLGDIRDYIAV